MARNLEEKPRSKVEYITRRIGGKDGYYERIPVNTNAGVGNSTKYDEIDEDALIRQLADNGNGDLLTELTSQSQDISVIEQIQAAINEIVTNPKVAAVLPAYWKQDVDIKTKVAQLVQKHFGYPADEVINYI